MIKCVGVRMCGERRRSKSVIPRHTVHVTLDHVLSKRDMRHVHAHVYACVCVHVCVCVTTHCGASEEHGVNDQLNVLGRVHDLTEGGH